MTGNQLYELFSERVQQDVDDGIITESEANEIRNYAYDNYICEKAKNKKLPLQDRYRNDFQNLENKHNEKVDSIHRSMYNPIRTKKDKQTGELRHTNPSFSHQRSAELADRLSAEDIEYSDKINKLNKKYGRKEISASIPKPSKTTLATAGIAAAGFVAYKGGKALVNHAKANKTMNAEDAIQQCLMDPDYAYDYLTINVLQKISKYTKGHVVKLIATDYTAGPLLNKVHFSGKGHNRNRAEAEKVSNSMNKSNEAINILSNMVQEINDIDTPKQAQAYIRSHKALIIKLMK